MSLNKPIYLSSPTMHGEEKIFVEEAIASNWVTTEGVNIHCVESALKKLLNSNNVVSMASGTAAMHMALRVAGSLVYGNNSRYQEHVLCGKKVFCQDLTFVASVNPVLYEGGEVILIDSEKFCMKCFLKNTQKKYGEGILAKFQQIGENNV